MFNGTTELETGAVAKVVNRMLARRGVATALTTESDLKNSGLTSLDMVNLMLAVEVACDVTIPQSAMTPENFTSIATIEALIATLQSGAAHELPRVDTHTM
jgi:acyl carrier protein